MTSGPLSRTSLSDTLFNFAEESNTILIDPFFCGWYTPIIGRYHLSLLSGKGGASSACPFSNILSMNVVTCYFLVGFRLRLRSSADARFMACGSVLGKGGL